MTSPNPARDEAVAPDVLAKQVADAASDMCEIARIVGEWRHGPKQSLTAVREIRACLAAKPPASGVVDAVAVKALEWTKKDLNSQFSVASWEALGFGGYYTVEERRTGVFDLWLPNGPEGTRHASPDEAMAAAQAIHEAGIRSALSPAPVSEADEIDLTIQYLRCADDDLTSAGEKLISTRFSNVRSVIRDAIAVLERAALAKPAAERIADTVLTWMIERDLLDAGNEYDAPDVLAVLNDLVEDAPAATEAKGVAVNPWLGCFDAAMQAVLCGGRANRGDWNRPSHIERRTIDGLSNPTIVMVMKDGAVGPYTPSGCDMVASDWSIHRD